MVGSKSRQTKTVGTCTDRMYPYISFSSNKISYKGTDSVNAQPSSIYNTSTVQPVELTNSPDSFLFNAISVEYKNILYNNMITYN